MTDTINPQHYKGAGGLEVIDVIEAFGLQGDYYLATALKYILRSGKKKAPTGEDLSKAIWFLERRKTKSLEGRYVPRRWMEGRESLPEPKQTEHLADGIEDSGESARVRSTR